MSLFPVVSRCVSLFLCVFSSFYNRFSSFLVVVSLFFSCFSRCFSLFYRCCIVVSRCFLVVSRCFLVVLSLFSRCFSLFLVVFSLFSCCFLIWRLLGRRLAPCRRRFAMFLVPVPSWEGLTVDRPPSWASFGALLGTIFGLQNRFLTQK